MDNRRIHSVERDDRGNDRGNYKFSTVTSLLNFKRQYYILKPM